jgi:hypothetical protein
MKLLPKKVYKPFFVMRRVMVNFYADQTVILLANWVVGDVQGRSNPG